MYISKRSFLHWLEPIPPDAVVDIKQLSWWTDHVHVTVRWFNQERPMARSITLGHKSKWAMNLLQIYKDRKGLE